MKSVVLWKAGETDLDHRRRMATWLQHNMPPAVAPKYTEKFIRGAHVILISRADHWLAAVVLIQFDPAVLEVHAASSQYAKGRWLDRRVIRLINTVEDMLGVNGCVSHVTSPVVARVLKGFGFSFIGNLAVRKREERLKWEKASQS